MSEHKQQKKIINNHQPIFHKFEIRLSSHNNNKKTIWYSFYQKQTVKKQKNECVYRHTLWSEFLKLQEITIWTYI